ncbi:hypothetical protein SAMN04488100_10525 [Alkalibacterium putridalgicola]|uniref:Phage protein n=1 Tax=Alkalibacterium putridalgicola TaxID=426703 RepID=A0A1H7RLI5_9LACT|nr:hypothetical protein [Alkalibacterium putridalgicola]GEK88884.1 hypothetical protein APU01nite_09230 [Alkalibacterium putridalgicola]SEL60694.1 hypothetical protein SAMN04488100_10525 [Alkalibacterium putridalgicola]
MIEFLTELTNQFRTVVPESYHERNRRSTVSYPYVTFDFDSESLERNVEGFYIDVDIFDNNASYYDVFQVEEALKAHFKDNHKLTEELFIRFNFLRSTKIPTGDDLIKRRNMQFYCKTDWRTR